MYFPGKICVIDCYISQAHAHTHTKTHTQSFAHALGCVRR